MRLPVVGEAVDLAAVVLKQKTDCDLRVVGLLRGHRVCFAPDETNQQEREEVLYH
jgi:hypothetical protein